MRTVAYVDGYNLYHGRLKHTAHKWLDLHALIASILHAQDPASELVTVRFYTAMVKSRLARLGMASADAQQTYHRAIANRGVEIVLGEFRLDEGTAPIRVDGAPPDRDKRVNIWSLSEKQTDVQLALGIYRDVAAARCEQIVLCTNDSDLAPVLQAVREDYPNVRVGVILPRHPETLHRRSASLEQLAHWTRHHITDEELATARLPDRVPTRKKPAIKPPHW